MVDYIHTAYAPVQFPALEHTGDKSFGSVAALTDIFLKAVLQLVAEGTVAYLLREVKDFSTNSALHQFKHRIQKVLVFLLETADGLSEPVLGADVVFSQVILHPLTDALRVTVNRF